MTGVFVADHSEQTQERSGERDNYHFIFNIHLRDIRRDFINLTLIRVIQHIV